MQPARLMHGSCAARDGAGVLVLGPPGSGKSDLVLRLLGRGFTLVADDQVQVSADALASPPDQLAGLLETRGLGITRLPYLRSASLALIVELGGVPDRLPTPHAHPDLNLPVIRVDARAASAVDRIMLALDCVTGRASQVAGAFAA